MVAWHYWSMSISAVGILFQLHSLILIQIISFSFVISDLFLISFDFTSPAV